MTLQDFFDRHPAVALAFSGGADSAYLLYAAKAAGAQVRAYFADTPLQPRFELSDAVSVARQLAVPLTVLPLDLLHEPSIAQNQPDRCYYCKMRIFSAIARAARKDGFTMLMDGTNASDSASDRPGMRALQELSVASPLRLAGLTKADVRRLSKEAGLFTWEKPAFACLATRIPTGVPLTPEALQITEAAEARLASLGFSDFRIRFLDGAARIQLKAEQLPRALERRTDILDILLPLYRAVMLDLEVRP